jgi:HPt (histidine-containing phosphotransfer) domain-containing protein
MKNKRRVFGVFIVIIIMLFIYGVVHDYVYNQRITMSDAIEFDKSDFVDMAFPKYSAENRELNQGEEFLRHYRITFDKERFGHLLSDYKAQSRHWYLVLEKPDAQYVEVMLNNHLLGSLGAKNGRANLWNGVFYIKFTENLIKEDNTLIITMYSEYMAGITGRIFIVPEEDYRTLSMISRFSERFIDASIIVAIFASLIILMMLIAWKDQLYNKMAYVFFLSSIIFLAIGLIDFQKSMYMILPYLTFKKLMLFSYHIAITFTGLGVALLLNARYKWSFGMVGLAGIIFAIMRTSDMISFRMYYAQINYFLLLALGQIIFMLLYYRKRATIGVNVLIIGFTLAGTVIFKTVMITSLHMSSSAIIDFPLVIIIYVTIVLFLFYLEMIQIVSDYDIGVVDEVYELGTTSYMQGSFTIGKSLCVTGAYATACDHIFNRHIVGVTVTDLLCSNDEEKKMMEETLALFFDPSYSFKEGFIALLPRRIEQGNRVYQVNYNSVERSSTLLKITLSDITRSVALEKQLVEEHKKYEFIINALKSRQEVGDFIEHIRDFMQRLRSEGFTLNNRSELHTIKGNLGQFGSYEFEQAVHCVEDQLTHETYDKEALIETLEKGIQATSDLITKYIGLEYFEEGYKHIILSQEIIDSIEDAYKRALEDPEALLELGLIAPQQKGLGP